MNSKQIRDWIEVVGIVAVVVSLLLLGYELRQTRDAMLGNTHQAMTSNIAERYRDMASNESALAAAVQAQQDRAALSDKQKLMLSAFSAAVRFELDSYYYQYELGLLSDEFYEYVLVPEFQYWYPLFVANGSWTNARLRPSFRAAVEAAQSI